MDPSDPCGRKARIDQLIADFIQRQASSIEGVAEQSLISQHPDLMPELAEQLQYLKLVRQLQDAATSVEDTPDARYESTCDAVQIRCPYCNSEFRLSNDCELQCVTCCHCQSQFSLTEDAGESNLSAGDQLGRFELQQLLGQGGFGSVWKAYDPQLERMVALKLPRWGRLSVGEVQMFVREARAAAQIKHPNIVAIYEVGKEGEHFFLVCDFIDGQSLAQRLKSETRFSQPAAIELVESIARTVGGVHQHGVVHRDLKPSNILLDGDGVPHVGDFGLAIRTTAQDLTMTLDGQVVGTPTYMAPEQARGDSHTVDCRSDIYSLGTIFYELLTGEVPFRGLPAAVFRQIEEDDPISPRKLNPLISRDIETICLKCLNKSPESRFQTADSLADDLQRYRQGKAIHSRPIGALGRFVRWSRRRPAVASLSALLLAAGLVSTFLLGANRQQQKSLQLARRREYVSDILQAQLASDAGNSVATRERLADYAPGTDRSDLREWEWYYLSQTAAAKFVSRAGDRGYAVAFSPDGKWLVWAEGRSQGRIYVSDATARDTREVVGFHEKMVNDLDVSPDSKTIVTASDDGTFKFWDLETGRLQETANTGAKIVWQANYWRNGTCVAVTTQDPTEFLIYEIATGAAAQRISLPNGDFFKLSVFPDGRHFAVSFRASDLTWVIAVYDTDAEGALVWKKKANRCDISPNGETIVLSSTEDDQTTSIDFCEPLTGKVRSTQQVLNFAGNAVSAISFSTDGQNLVVGGDAGTSSVFDVLSGEQLGVTVAPGRIMDIATSPDSQHFATVGDTGRVSVWEYEQQPNPLRLAGSSLVTKLQQVFALSFSPDGTRLLATTRARDNRGELGQTEIRIWLMPEGTLYTSRILQGNVSACFHPDNHTVLIGYSDSIVEWDPTADSENQLCDITDIGDGPSRLKLSPDGKRFGYCIGESSPEFPGPKIAFYLHSLESPSDHLVLGGSSQENSHHQWLQSSPAFSSDSRRLVSIGRERSLKVWDLQTGNVVYSEQSPSMLSLTSHSGLSSDDRLLAVGYGDGRISVRRFADQQELARFRHDARTHVMKFMPDNETLVSCSADKTVRLWDIPTKQLRIVLRGHASPIYSLAISPDGKLIASGDYDGKIFIWRGPK